MTKDQYLEMMDQMGEDPDMSKCPDDWGDFPDLVITGVNIYNTLGNRVYPDIGYVGKDFTTLDFLIELNGIEEHNKEWIHEIIQFLETEAIQDSQRRLKAEHERMRRK